MFKIIKNYEVTDRDIVVDSDFTKNFVDFGDVRSAQSINTKTQKHGERSYFEKLPRESLEREVSEDMLAEENNSLEIEEVPFQSEEERIIEEAMNTAEEIIKGAQAHVNHIRESAHEEGFKIGHTAGYNEGFEKGMKEARHEAELKYSEEFKFFKEALAQEITDVGEEKQRILDTYIDDLKDIALAIGEKIVQASLKSSKEVIQRMILTATEKMKKTGWAKIYIGGGDTVLEIQGDTEFMKNLANIAENVKLVVTEEEFGTIIIETSEEILDASVKTQLDNIKETVNNARM